MTTLLSDRTAIYSGAFLQGAVVVIFSAYTAVFVARYHYNLTLAQYGALFVPQVVAAVVAALFAAHVGSWLRAERAHLAGLGCSLAGMALLVATEWAERLPVSYPLLLAATAMVGAGAGLTFPFLRCYAVSLRPWQARRQILLVNALLAAGMVATPVYATLTRGTGAWWSLPVLLGVFLIAQMLLSRSLRAPPDGAPARHPGQHLPDHFRAYPWLALLYGFCAVICLTAPHYLTGKVPSSHHLHFLEFAEVAFWAALVAVGRVVFALIDGMKSRQHLASIGVFLTGIIVLVLSATLTTRYDMMHVGIYLLAAIGCAALLPIDTRPGNEHLAAFPLAVTIGLMAAFPVGLGLARFAYDNVQRDGMSPLGIYAGVAFVGAAACILMMPIILSWRTMGYFDSPFGRNSRLSAAGHSGDAGPPGASPAGRPPRPRDRPEDDNQGGEPDGATAIRRGTDGSPRRPGP